MFVSFLIGFFVALLLTPLFSGKRETRVQAYISMYMDRSYQMMTQQYAINNKDLWSVPFAERFPLVSQKAQQLMQENPKFPPNLK